MKNTSEKPRAIFEFSSRPNRRKKIGAKTRRGSAFSTWMNGFSTRDHRSERARTKPTTTPATAPSTKLINASYRVMNTLLRMMPLCSHSARRPAMRDGRDQMKGSIRKRFGPVGTLVPTSQTTMTAIRIAAWRPTTSARLLPLARIGCHHLLAQAAPHPLVHVAEAWHEARLDHVPRAGQPRPVIPFEVRAGPRREQQHAVGQGDRLLQIVRDEQHRRALLLPQPEQLLFHERPSLHVQRTERLVHQQNGRTVHQHLGHCDPFALPARQL